MNMNSNNILIWVLVSGLFLASAFRCSSKKESGLSGRFVLDHGHPEVDGSSHKADASQSTQDGVNDEHGTSHGSLAKFSKEVEHALAEIEAFSGEMVTWLSSEAYKNFLQCFIKRKERFISWKSGYYRACSIAWIYLKNSGIADGSVGGDLNDLVHLLSKKYPWDGHYKAYARKICAMDPGILGNKIRDLMQTSEVLLCQGVPILLDEFISNFMALQQALNDLLSENPLDYWLWDAGDGMGRMTMLLAKIEWVLRKVVFGRNAWDRLDGGKLDNSFGKLVDFYKGKRSIGWKGMANIDFNALGNQIRDALENLGENPSILQG